MENKLSAEPPARWSWQSLREKNTRRKPRVRKYSWRLLMAKKWLSLMHLNGRRKSYPLITNPGPCTPVQNHLVTHLLHHTAKKAPWQRAETKTHTVRTSMATGTSSEFITEVDRDLFLHRNKSWSALLICPHYQSYPRQTPGWTSTAIHSFCCQKSAQILEQSCWLGIFAFGITQLLLKGRDMTDWCHGLYLL